MLSNFEQLCQTIAHLRGPDGCPWDREQTHISLTRYLIEETHEVLEAINTHDFDLLKDELGDLLLQIVLQAQLASEKARFDINDVAKAINDKMISRHPHVFTEKKLSSSAEVLLQWEEIKDAERRAKSSEKDNITPENDKNNATNGSSLDNIPSTLPALLKALKVSEKAVNQGFEWEQEDDIWQQLNSEIIEFKEEVKKASGKPSVAQEAVCLEMGDILFTIVNIARWYKIDPEEALLLTIEKFKKRFRLMEKASKSALKELTTSQLNELWQQAKGKK